MLKIIKPDHSVIVLSDIQHRAAASVVAIHLNYNPTNDAEYYTALNEIYLNKDSRFTEFYRELDYPKSFVTQNV